MAATVTTKGQITIPKEVRDLLGVEAGSKVGFRRGANGEVVVYKAGPAAKSRFARVRGAAGPGPSTEEIMALLRGDEP